MLLREYLKVICPPANSGLISDAIQGQILVPRGSPLHQWEFYLRNGKKPRGKLSLLL